MSTTDIAVIPVPEPIKQLAQSALARAMVEVEVADAFVITNPQEAELAAAQLQVLNRFSKDWDERRLEQTRPYDQLKKDITAEFSPALDKVNLAATKLRSSILQWQTKERQRVEAERAAEQKRIADEQRRAQEEADRQAARAETLRTEEAREKAVAKAEEASARVQELAVTAPTVTKAQKLSGISERKTYKFEVTDKAALIKAAAADPKLAMYLAVDEKTVGQVVKAMKENTDIPGIRVYVEAGLTVR